MERAENSQAGGRSAPRRSGALAVAGAVVAHGHPGLAHEEVREVVGAGEAAFGGNETLRLRQSCAVLAIVLAGGAAAAEFPAVVDGLLSLDGSESVTYDQALPEGITRLVKIGSGEAVLTAASSAFNGSVEVKEGTLTLKDAGAVGTGTKNTSQTILSIL